MSFGFAIGDFVAVGDLAFPLYKDVYKVSRAAPAEFRELAKELGVLSSSIQLLTEEAQNAESVLVKAGQRRVDMVNEMMSSTKETLEKLDAYAKKHEILTGSADSRSLLRRGWDRLKFAKDVSSINSLRMRLSYHCGVMNLVLTSIGNSSLERMENGHQAMARNFEESLELIRAIAQSSHQTQSSQQSHMSIPPRTTEGTHDDRGHLEALDPSKLDFCRVLYDYTPQVAGADFGDGLDLSVIKGELVAVITRLDPAGEPSEWWRCRSRDGRFGYLPLINLETIQRRRESQYS